MKHGKNPTKAQKIILKEHHLNPDNWLIAKNTPTELLVVHRYTSATRSIRKEPSEMANQLRIVANAPDNIVAKKYRTEHRKEPTP